MTADGYRSALNHALRAEIRDSIAASRARRPVETLIGYAILTDDGMMTVFPAVLTQEALRAASEPSYARFQPDEWPEDDLEFPHSSALLLANLDQAETNEAFAAHVESSFSAFVEALAQVRSEDGWPDDLFLAVQSTDPCEKMEQRAQRAVQALNSTSTWNSWKRWRAELGAPVPDDKA